MAHNETIEHIVIIIAGVFVIGGQRAARRQLARRVLHDILLGARSLFVAVPYGKFTSPAGSGPLSRGPFFISEHARRQLIWRPTNQTPLAGKL